MTIEQKAKAYDEAKARMSRAFNSIRCTIGFMNEIFPELKSEDDRIRRAIISYINIGQHNGVSNKDMIDWLEKQCEQHSPIDINKMVDEFAHIEVKGYGIPSMIEVDAYRKGIEDAYVRLEKRDEPKDNGEISDGYHTFNELYRYRMLYNAAFFNLLPKELVHKSKKHHDGEECFGGGWFIVMANLPTGQISNHYELKYWDLFQIPEKDVSDEWDGHTPQNAADRLNEYLLEKQCEQTQLYYEHEEKDLEDLFQALPEKIVDEKSHQIYELCIYHYDGQCVVDYVGEIDHDSLYTFGGNTLYDVIEKAWNWLYKNSTGA